MRLEEPEKARDPGQGGGDIAEAAVPHARDRGGDGLLDRLGDHRDLDESGGRTRTVPPRPLRAHAARLLQTFYFFGDVLLYPAAMGAAVLVASTALVALRTAVLPRWAAWPSMVLALWLLIPPLGQGVDAPENPAPWTGLAVLPFVLLWTALIALVLVRRRDA